MHVNKSPYAAVVRWEQVCNECVTKCVRMKRQMCLLCTVRGGHWTSLTVLFVSVSVFRCLFRSQQRVNRHEFFDITNKLIYIRVVSLIFAIPIQYLTANNKISIFFFYFSTGFGVFIYRQHKLHWCRHHEFVDVISIAFQIVESFFFRKLK